MKESWVVIPCHNNADLLSTAITSILHQTIPVRIFAINNASTDNVPFVLAGLGDEHVVINAYPQLGVAGAWNMALSYLFSTGVDRVLVVNQDIILRPDTYETLDNDGGPFVTAVSVGLLSQLSDADTKNSGRGKRPHPDFSCFRITKRCYEKVGPFDEGFYPAWFEDNDYHIRMARAGIEAYCIDLPFYHYAAGTMKRASEYDAAHYYGPAFMKSKQRFYDKYGVYPGTKEYEDLCATS